MNGRNLEERMDNLERIVEPLRDLPNRMTKVEAQIVQLRTEMRVEFSSIRRDMATKEDVARCASKEDLARCATKEDVAKCATKEDLARCATKEDVARCATKEDLARCATKEDLARCATKEDLARCATKEDLERLATKDEMRMLHEDLVERLKLLGEGLSRHAKRSRKTP